MHVMLDLETLDTKATSVILSIGMASFDSAGVRGKLLLYPKIDEQFEEGRTVSSSTLLWWFGQSEQARMDLVKGERLSKPSVEKAIVEWLSAQGKLEGMWGNGSDFDNPMLSHYLPGMWQYFLNRCYRTLKSVYGKSAPKPPVNSDAHNALSDAVWQAEHLILINKAVGGIL